MQVALLDGVPIIAFELTEEEFAEVKLRYRADHASVKFSDGLEAIPRSGKTVVAHFSHKAGEGGATEPETIHHIRAKRVIRDIARSRYWDAEIEARHPDGIWQADVLLTRPGKSVAFEVQWSPQTVEEYSRRSERYRTCGVGIVWLARYARRTWQDIERAVPALPYRSEGVGEFEVRSLEEVVGACLAHLEAADEIPADAPRIMKEECYKCHKPFGYHAASELWGAKEPLNTEETKVLGRWAALLKTTYSRTAKTTYPAWHCPHCHAMQGDFYLGGEPFALVEGVLVPDNRGFTLWHLLRNRLEPVGRSPETDIPQDEG